MSELLLPRRGTLVSWTTQGFPPSFDYKGDPTGASFEPYGVGLVQLDDVVRVESRLTESDPERLDFGMEVELRIIPYYEDADGNEIITFAFAPIGVQSKKER
ncbi:MAG: OB-fold domain-containing protein [Acidimicrobiales bacterium]